MVTTHHHHHHFILDCLHFTFLNKIVPFPRPLLQLFGKLLLDVCSLLDECYEVLAESLPIIYPPGNKSQCSQSLSNNYKTVASQSQ